MDLSLAYLIDLIGGESYKRRWEYREKVEKSEEINTHATTNPYLMRRILERRFPSEPLAVTQYRLCNFSHVTKAYFEKVHTTLSQIRRADDFRVTYPNDETRDFCVTEFEDHESVVDWYFDLGLRGLLCEPNGFMVVLPEGYIEGYEDEDSYEPEVFIVPARLVVDSTSDYLLYRLEDRYEGDNHFEPSPKIFWYIDKYEIVRLEWIETSKENPLKITQIAQFPIPLETEPFIKFGGKIADLAHMSGKAKTYESFIAGVVGFWNQALLEYSDKQAAIKMHVYPERWVVVTSKCTSCGGDGKITSSNALQGTFTSSCITCGGTGFRPTGPFTEHRIEVESGLFQADVPIPGIGYVEKSFESVTYLDADFERNIYAGLAALNMEFLADVPANQSGVAKEMDRQELAAFLYQVASHAINNNLKPLIRLICMWLGRKDGNQATAARYDTEAYDNTFITIPVHYNLTAQSGFAEQIRQAKEAGLSLHTINGLEKKYIETKFVNYDDERAFLLAVNELNPLAGVTPDLLPMFQETGMATEIDCITALNIERLVKESAEQNDGFYEKSYEEKQAILAERSAALLEQIRLEKLTNDLLATPAPKTKSRTINPNENANVTQPELFTATQVAG